MEALPQKLQDDIAGIVSGYPASKSVFQSIINYYEPLSRKYVKTFNCLITKEKLEKLPDSLIKIQVSKKRKLLFTLSGKNQHMFTVEDATEETATEWVVMEEIKLMHSGKIYLCDSGVVLHYAKNSFGFALKDIKTVQIIDLTTHNCTVAVNDKNVDYFPLDKVDLIQSYCEQAGKEFILPRSKVHANRVLQDLMDSESEDEDEDFKGGAGAAEEQDDSD
eukprot:NODE_133_length_18153_cov_0.298050.p9 type:complete len:220 gc:universal NODE_133_length_18153_cov_0.298050:7211-7870(+)